MPTEMEKLRAAKRKREEAEAKTAASAKATFPNAQAIPGAAAVPPSLAEAAASATAPGQAPPQTENIKLTIVGVLKQREIVDGVPTERGVSQVIVVPVPVGFPKSQYERIMPQIWNLVTKQIGGLQITNEDGSFTFYKDDLFERYGATFNEVVGVSIA